MLIILFVILLDPITKFEDLNKTDTAALIVSQMVN